MPGVYDALSDKIAEIGGFIMVANSGGSATARMGLPYLGSYHWGKCMINRIREKVRAISISLFADVDKCL